MRQIIIATIVILLVNGCQNRDEQAKHDAKVAAKAKAELLAQIEANKTKKSSKLNQFGIKIDKNIITIDTNQTKNYIKKLGENMQKHIKKVSEDIKKGVINAKDEGIEMKNQHINIDLNKTKRFFDVFKKNIEEFTEKIDKVTQEIETNNTKGY